MGFSDIVEQMAIQKEQKRNLEDLKRLINQLEGYDLEGIDEFLDEIRNLKELDTYKLLIEAVITSKLNGTKPLTINEISHVKILNLAKSNLRSGNLLKTIFTGSLITLNDVVSIYSFIESVYYINICRKLNQNDLFNIHFSRLDERIIFALDDFDEIDLKNLPEPSPEYFQELKKVKWNNKKSKNFYKKLMELMSELTNFALNYPDLNKWIKYVSKYRSTEDLFILTLAGCSAVNNNRLTIKEEDVIIAYKTFFKLIKTDVTKYKADPLIVQDMHEENPDYSDVLVCKNCGEYYKLEPGESPANFESCHCGGELKHVPDKRS